MINSETVVCTYVQGNIDIKPPPFFLDKVPLNLTTSAPSSCWLASKSSRFHWVKQLYLNYNGSCLKPDDLVGTYTIGFADGDEARSLKMRQV